MQGARQNCIVPVPESQSPRVSSEFGTRWEHTAEPLLCIRSCSKLPLLNIASEGCVSLSGGAEHSLKVTAPCSMLLCSCSCEGCKHKCSNLVAVSSANCAEATAKEVEAAYFTVCLCQKPPWTEQSWKELCCGEVVTMSQVSKDKEWDLSSWSSTDF